VQVGQISVTGKGLKKMGGGPAASPVRLVKSTLQNCLYIGQSVSLVLEVWDRKTTKNTTEATDRRLRWSGEGEDITGRLWVKEETIWGPGRYLIKAWRYERKGCKGGFRWAQILDWCRRT